MNNQKLARSTLIGHALNLAWRADTVQKIVLLTDNPGMKIQWGGGGQCMVLTCPPMDDHEAMIEKGVALVRQRDPSSAYAGLVVIGPEWPIVPNWAIDCLVEQMHGHGARDGFIECAGKWLPALHVRNLEINPGPIVHCVLAPPVDTRVDTREKAHAMTPIFDMARQLLEKTKAEYVLRPAEERPMPMCPMPCREPQEAPPMLERVLKAELPEEKPKVKGKMAKPEWACRECKKTFIRDFPNRKTCPECRAKLAATAAPAG